MSEWIALGSLAVAAIALIVGFVQRGKAATARDQRLQAAELAIKQRYGKNSIMKLKNYEPRATMRIRNRQVGGHRA